MRLCAFFTHASVFFPRFPRPLRRRLRGRGTAGQTCCMAGGDRHGRPDSARHRRRSHPRPGMADGGDGRIQNPLFVLHISAERPAHCSSGRKSLRRVSLKCPAISSGSMIGRLPSSMRLTGIEPMLDTIIRLGRDPKGHVQPRSFSLGSSASTELPFCKCC
jgi:hypothetical protein